MAGYVKIHREMQNHWVWEDPDHLRAWIDLIMLANWDRKTVVFNGHAAELERGQLFASERFLVSRWAWTRHEVRGFLAKLTATGMIERDQKTAQKPAQKPTKNQPKLNHPKKSKITLITVVNYDKWQGDSTKTQPKTDHKTAQKPAQKRAQNKESINNSDQGAGFDQLDHVNGSDQTRAKPYVVTPELVDEIAPTVERVYNALGHPQGRWDLPNLAKIVVLSRTVCNADWLEDAVNGVKVCQPTEPMPYLRTILENNLREFSDLPFNELLKSIILPRRKRLLPWPCSLSS